MRTSLQTKASLFVTLIIIVISLISTYLFTSAHSRSKDKGLIARGTALSYSLSKAAEEGLINEDLDLIKKSSNIVRAPDVILAQVFSDIWEAVDAYPLDRLKEAPDPYAVGHFKEESSPVSIKTHDGYDFYSPIFFKASEESPPITVGFVRIVLSSAAIQKELRKIVAVNVAVSAAITLLAIISINILIRRLVISPVMALYRSVSRFKNGALPDDTVITQQPTDEIRELSREFYQMCLTVREKEKRLIDSEGRIKSLFERVEHAIFRLDQDGRIVEKNLRFEEMFGEVGRLCEILAGEKKATDCLRSVLSENALHREEKVIDRDGNELSVLLSLYPETGEAGSVKGFDGYIIDMTDKKRLEERLLRSQKLEAVGTLAGGIAHDFNNLLTAIIGYSEIMLERVKDEDPLHQYADIIHNAAEKGAELTRRILNLARKEKMETKLLDMNESVRNSLELLQRSIPRNIEIVTNLKESLPKIKADSSQMQQVILNLAVNARDAMPDGGRLTVETDVEGMKNGGKQGSVGEERGFVKLSVSDTGIGMDKGTQDKIFDPFFTTKEMGKGTGLGLYMVHSIVNNHGGYINLYSEPDRGTRFAIYLPIASDLENEASHEDRDLRGSETILVIDDETYVREMCRDILTPLGYKVLLAEDGPAGIETFRGKREEIALVVLDMIMPRLSGNEVFSALKTIKPEVRVLLCSGYSSNGFAGIDRLLQSGASGFVQKPFSRQNIAAAIKDVLLRET